eukprot:gnl/MRDRNA2_/MRDRNA2_81058_c0_seq2.p1 gnl/MRDRNA2_/MRDRNA2_81058_c0~~gnl/MRDRNA2_/MRDRNA2_81058_c0_seq2.p1  ORF type:complete len:434 (-),score=84.35 gnl/MRDRNA2_/MRDRNA2_81058_c0_seq2:856-2157(-)
MVKYMSFIIYVGLIMQIHGRRFNSAILKVENPEPAKSTGTLMNSSESVSSESGIQTEDSQSQSQMISDDRAAANQISSIETQKKWKLWDKIDDFHHVMFFADDEMQGTLGGEGWRASWGSFSVLDYLEFAETETDGEMTNTGTFARDENQKRSKIWISQNETTPPKLPDLPAFDRRYSLRDGEILLFQIDSLNSGAVQSENLNAMLNNSATFTFEFQNGCKATWYGKLATRKLPSVTEACPNFPGWGSDTTNNLVRKIVIPLTYDEIQAREEVLHPLEGLDDGNLMDRAIEMVRLQPYKRALLYLKFTCQKNKQHMELNKMALYLKHHSGFRQEKLDGLCKRRNWNLKSIMEEKRSCKGWLQKEEDLCPKRFVPKDESDGDQGIVPKSLAANKCCKRDKRTCDKWFESKPALCQKPFIRKVQSEDDDSLPPTY